MIAEYRDGLPDRPQWAREMAAILAPLLFFQKDFPGGEAELLCAPETQKPLPERPTVTDQVVPALWDLTRSELRLRFFCPAGNDTFSKLMAIQYVRATPGQYACLLLTAYERPRRMTHQRPEAFNMSTDKLRSFFSTADCTIEPPFRDSEQLEIFPRDDL